MAAPSQCRHRDGTGSKFSVTLPEMLNETFLIATIVVYQFSCSPVIPEDSKPVSVVSPLIDRTELVDEVQSGESRNEYIYLFDENERLSPVLRVIPRAELRVTDLINELTADLLPTERKATLSTTVPSGLSLAGVTQEDDLAIINFNYGGLELIEGDELAKALAQIVWTLTETGDLDSIIISISDIKTWPTTNSGDQQLLRRIQFMSYVPTSRLESQGKK